MIKTAKITKRDGYKCAPSGHTIEFFPYGEIVTGQVAEWAISDNAASSMMVKNAGAAPENKSRAPKRGVE